MLKTMLVLLFAVLFALPSKADQLSYITKSQAKKASKLLKKLEYVYLFCGCCEADEKVKAKVLRAKVMFTGYEDYFQVQLTYLDESGQKITDGIDLAYVWTNKSNKIKTIGELLNFEHDPCERIGVVGW